MFRKIANFQEKIESEIDYCALDFWSGLQSR